MNLREKQIIIKRRNSDHLEDPASRVSFGEIADELQKTEEGRWMCFSRHHLHCLMQKTPEGRLQRPKCPIDVTDYNPLCTHSSLKGLHDAITVATTMNIISTEERNAVRRYIAQNQRNLFQGDSIQAGIDGIICNNLGLLDEERSGEADRELLQAYGFDCDPKEMNLSHAQAIGNKYKEEYGEPIFNLTVAFNRGFQAGVQQDSVHAFRATVRREIEESISIAIQQVTDPVSGDLKPVSEPPALQVDLSHLQEPQLRWIQLPAEPALSSTPALVVD